MENQTIDPKVVSRIQKMLNLARDGATSEAEAVNIMDAVEKTMRKFNLTMAEVEAGGGAAGEGSKRTKHQSKGKAQYEFQQQLMRTCAEVNYCVALLVSEWKAGRFMASGFVLIGREGNVIATRELYDYLNATTERLAFEYVGRDNKQRLSRSAVSFKKGCAERLGERLSARHRAALEEQAREARERNATPSTGTALAVVMKDFARDEQDANEDVRWGAPEGTTAMTRRKNEAEGRVYNAIATAIRKCENKDREVLLEEGSKAAAPVALAHGVGDDRVEMLVESIVDLHLMHVNKPVETPAQKAKREEQERKSNERFWERQRKARERDRANTDWRAKDAGIKAGETVGLDKQVKDGPAPAGRLK